MLIISLPGPGGVGVPTATSTALLSVAVLLVLCHSHWLNGAAIFLPARLIPESLWPLTLVGVGQGVHSSRVATALGTGSGAAAFVLLLAFHAKGNGKGHPFGMKGGKRASGTSPRSGG